MPAQSSALLAAMAPSPAPRLTYEQLTPELQQLLAPRVQRLGYLGGFFAVAGHQPDALCGFVRYTESLKAALPWRLTEAIALTVAAASGNDYERVQHERLALALGMSQDEVRALVGDRVRTDGAGFAPEERAAVLLAHALLGADWAQARRAHAELTAHCGAETAIGCCMVAARYLAHAAMAHCWALKPPVASPLDDGGADD